MGQNLEQQKEIKDTKIKYKIKSNVTNENYKYKIKYKRLQI